LLPGLFNILVTELNVICADGLLPAMESTPTPKDMVPIEAIVWPIARMAPSTVRALTGLPIVALEPDR